MKNTGSLTYCLTVRNQGETDGFELHRFQCTYQQFPGRCACELALPNAQGATLACTRWKPSKASAPSPLLRKYAHARPGKFDTSTLHVAAPTAALQLWRQVLLGCAVPGPWGVWSGKGGLQTRSMRTAVRSMRAAVKQGVCMLHSNKESVCCSQTRSMRAAV